MKAGNGYCAEFGLGICVNLGSDQCPLLCISVLEAISIGRCYIEKIWWSFWGHAGEGGDIEVRS